MKKRSVFKCVMSVVSFLLLIAFLAACTFALVITIQAKKDSTGSVEIQGYRLMNVDSDSMASCEETDVSGYEIKSIPLRSMIVIESVPKDAAAADAWYASLKVGDVLTFQYVYHDQLIITHRITSIMPDEENGGYTIYLAGDNKESASAQLTQVIHTADSSSLNYVIGKVVKQNFLFGFFISILKEPIGVVLAIIVPCFLFILIEIVKVVNLSHAEQSEKAARMAEAEKQAALRRQRQRDGKLLGTVIGIGALSLFGNWLTAQRVNNIHHASRFGNRRRW